MKSKKKKLLAVLRTVRSLYGHPLITLVCLFFFPFMPQRKGWIKRTVVFTSKEEVALVTSSF